MIYVTVAEEDVKAATNAFGMIAAEACADCGKPTPKTVTMDDVGWVAALCVEEPEKATAWVAGYPLHSAHCPGCAPNRCV
jgi:hypothetical protein